MDQNKILTTILCYDELINHTKNFVYDTLLANRPYSIYDRYSFLDVDFKFNENIMHIHLSYAGRCDDIEILSLPINLLWMTELEFKEFCKNKIP